ncbi:SUMF1/EgtB/PvdO family nonheme iron enzyme [Dysgonomonas termitidis]|uniref:SUMF1/EgtB/PvdO family nonheme iron enzyme n=1 Tax=Dysgonomonas termitidis TaxID=1516126 RepID=A0ABV9L026_9BACT
MLCKKCNFKNDADARFCENCGVSIENARDTALDSQVTDVPPHPSEPEMVYVQGGTFWMGCTPEQGNDCDENESPLHSVTLSDFYIGKYEITQKQWRLIMGTNVKQQRDKANANLKIYGEGDNYPMYYVSWAEVQEFIQRLNAATGKAYRLPTEAEWEYAARGGSRSRGYKYSGSDTAGEVAWYNDNSGDKTHPVGTKQANELGIYDMSGNVWEWCSDWYGIYPASAQTNPAGASGGSYRVYRGGSWYSIARSVRVPYRYNISPGYRYLNLGFRLACSSR